MPPRRVTEEAINIDLGLADDPDDSEIDARLTALESAAGIRTIPAFDLENTTTPIL